jgi:hypothetical protein
MNGQNQRAVVYQIPKLFRFLGYEEELKALKNCSYSIEYFEYENILERRFSFVYRTTKKSLPFGEAFSKRYKVFP